MKIKFFATGGTIDKVYFDQKSEYHVGEPKAVEILKDALVEFDYECESILYKDSLDLRDEDREKICETVRKDSCEKIVITHGTDTMVVTAKELKKRVQDKVIVLTGAMSPANFKTSDAVFNIGLAVGAVQTLPNGVYIAMNGQIFDPEKVQKNRDQHRFEKLS